MHNTSMHLRLLSAETLLDVAAAAGVAVLCAVLLRLLQCEPVGPDPDHWYDLRLDYSAYSAMPPATYSCMSGSTN